MAALAAGIVYTVYDFAADNYTRTYTRTESYGNKVLSAVSAACISLT